MSPTISYTELRRLLHYDPETGLFTRAAIASPKSRAKLGDRAGHKNRRGYINIPLGGRKGRLYQAHRLAWLYMTGEWPKDSIDHIDGDPSNNRWINLRECTNAQNSANRRLGSGNTSGLKGVCFNKALGKWQAQIRKDGKTFYLGLFDDPTAAHLAYVEKAKEFFGSFARAG